MLESVARVSKGFCMGFLFMLFFLGILASLFFVVPVVSLLNRVQGRNPSRTQNAIRFLVRFWLWLLQVCGLLTTSPPKGKPLEGPCIIVSNHPGLFDVLFLIRDIPNMCVMVKRALARKLPLGPVFETAGYVLSPDYRETGPLECIESAVEKVRRGYKFMVFPEATRSPKGGLGRFGSGPFMLSRLSNVPVQPVLMRNDPPFLPKEDRWYFPPFRVSNLELEFWEPLPPPEAGKERAYAAALEARYREALQLGQASGKGSGR